MQSLLIEDNVLKCVKGLFVKEKVTIWISYPCYASNGTGRAHESGSEYRASADLIVIL